jgi:aspartyl-tRNA synthetase
MIEIENLTMHYGPLKALDNLTLSIQPGELFAFLGPNGAGKTTAIKILTGLMKPTSGVAMVAGFDRYFQIAPCFRDEASRADRSPGEFYQLDFEMSFVTQEDVFATIEPVLAGVFEEFADWDGKGRTVAPGPFPHIPYAQAMLKYGVDKPDLRNPIICCDVSDIATREDVTLGVFRKIVDGGGIVRAIPAPNSGEQPRSFFDKMDAWAKKEMQAPGLGYIRFVEEDGKLSGTGPIAKFFAPEALAALAEKATLDNVRERELRSEKTWRGLAEQARKTAVQRVKAENERAEKRAAEAEEAAEHANRAAEAY